MSRTLSTLAFVTLFSFAARIDAATTLQPGFSEAEICNGVLVPISFAIVPDGRFFICEQSGSVRVVKNGQLLGPALITLKVDNNGMNGLSAIALDPNFASNGYLYLIYTTPQTSTAWPHNVLSRFTVQGDTADPATEVQLFQFDPFVNTTDHTEAAMDFGPDGKLWITTGNAGDSTAPQKLNLEFGKVLRLNSDGTIPSDNPMYTTNSGDYRSIWAYGLRNPYTFAIQPGSGQLIINDVDSTVCEELNLGVAGANYGWPNVSGTANDPQYVDPLYSFPYGRNSLTAGCAISGGTFYNPPVVQFPSSYVGKYFFMDYCNGWIQLIDPGNPSHVSLFASNMQSDIVALKTGLDGALYYIYRGNGALRRISYTPGNAPTITNNPADQNVPVGGSATFTVSADGTGPLTYQWQRDGSDIAGATTATYTFTNAALSDSGAKFHCTVTNTYGTATSNDATLTVSNRAAPSVSIDAPIDGTLYVAGQAVAFSGSGQDAVDGALPPSALTWKVDILGESQVRPFMAATSGIASGSFTPTQLGLADANVVYRITLTGTNSAGLSTTVTRDVHPTVATFHVQTDPDGLVFSIDGQGFATAQTLQGVVGFSRLLLVATPQMNKGQTYDFESWSDGGDLSHSITTPPTETTFVAKFHLRGAPVISGPTATPSPAFTGDAVNFSASATGNGPFTWQWDFGDGATSSDAQSTSHAYTNTGAFTVTLTVTDAQGMAATEMINVAVNSAQALTVTHLTAALDFKKQHDKSALTAALTATDSNLSQVPITIDISGATAAFVLNARGQGTSADGSRVVAHVKKSKTGAPTLTLTFALKDSGLIGAWAPLGVRTSATQSRSSMQLAVTITFNGTAYRALVGGLYSSKAGVSGKFAQN